MVMGEEIQKNIKKKTDGLQSSHLAINESNTHIRKFKQYLKV